MLSRVVLIMLLLAGLSPILLLPSPVVAQTSETSVLRVSPVTSNSSQSFSIQLIADLVPTDALNVYDLHLTYNPSVLNATKSDVVVASGALETANCVYGVGSGCDISDGPGIIHSAAGFTNTMYGPVSFTLFSVRFRIIGKGISIFHPRNDTLINPNRGNPQAIIHLTEDGVYSNAGVTAFFNVAPAILVVNHPILFDGSKSFNSNGTGIAFYSWDFGDGTVSQGPAFSQVSHNFTSIGNHIVTLTVMDQKGASGLIRKTISVMSGLGGIRISIRSSGGGSVPNAVAVSLYNGTFLVENATKPAQTTAIISFQNLSPGTYRLDFSGVGVVSSSLSETVIAGWTTFDTAFLTLVKSPSNGGDPVFLFFLVALGGAVVVGAIAVGNRRMRRPRAAPKTRNVSRSRPSSTR